MPSVTSPPEHPMAWWADGWARSRQTGSPVWRGGVGRIEVGTERESVRWLLPEPRTDVLRDLLSRPHPVNTAVKVFGEPAVWEQEFPEGWEADIPVVLMARQLVDEAVPCPSPYHLQREDEDHRILVRVLTQDERLAASGQVGLGATHAVPDQIVTRDGHRRRGLGSVVMAALGTAALERGRHRAVLGASADGRALYRRLGWNEVGPRTGMYYRPGRSSGARTGVSPAR